jgi:hypothetical protein
MYARRKFFVVLVSLITLAAARAAIGCSCIAIDPAFAYAHYGLVVLVRVTALQRSPIQGPWNVALLALKTWKGSWQPDMTVQVQTDGPSGPCGFFIHTGDEFIVYSQDPVTLTGIGLCSTVRGDDVPVTVQKLDALSSKPPQRDPNNRWRGP